MLWQGSARMTEHYVWHAQAAGCLHHSYEHVALQHGNQSLATCTTAPALSHACQEKIPGMCAGSSSLTPSQRRWSTPCRATAWYRCLRAETSMRPLMDIPAQSLCLTWPRGAACCAGSKTSCELCHPLPHAQLTAASQQVTPCEALRRGPQSRHARC